METGTWQVTVHKVAKSRTWLKQLSMHIYMCVYIYIWHLVDTQQILLGWILVFQEEMNDCCCCSVIQSCPTLGDPMNCSTADLPVPHRLLKFAQVRVHCIGDAIQPSHPLMPSSPLPFCPFPADMNDAMTKMTDYFFPIENWVSERKGL